MDGQPNTDLAQDFDKGEPIPGTKCMRNWCSEERWMHPTKGSLVLCKGHAAEVIRGEANAPPLRRGIDYQGSVRRSFVVEDLPTYSNYLKK